LAKKPLTNLGRVAYYLTALKNIRKGVVFVRSWAFKLFALLLATFLLLSFSFPSAAWSITRIKLFVITDGGDEHPVPNKMAARYFIIPVGWGGSYFILIQFKRKSSSVSDESSVVKQSGSPRVDEEIR
jgi:hypothetical protein